MTFYGRFLAQEDDFKEQMFRRFQGVAPCSGENVDSWPEAWVFWW